MTEEKKYYVKGSELKQIYEEIQKAENPEIVYVTDPLKAANDAILEMKIHIGNIKFILKNIFDSMRLNGEL